jgi:hypothetical protein
MINIKIQSNQDYLIESNLASGNQKKKKDLMPTTITLRHLTNSATHHKDLNK